MSTLAQRIKELKDLRKLTSQELSVLSGVPLGTLNKVLSSSTKSVKTETLKKIADALSVPVSTLLGERKERVKRSSETFGYVKVSAVTPMLKLGNVTRNTEIIKDIISSLSAKRVNLIVFPELCLSGKTVGDLIFQDLLLKKCEKSILEIADFSRNFDSLIFIGAPIKNNGKIYNCAVAICRGDILGVVPKGRLTNAQGEAESRFFAGWTSKNGKIVIGSSVYPFGKDLIFVNKDYPDLKVGVEVGDEVFSIKSPSTSHVLAGANVIVSLSSDVEYSGRARERRTVISANSLKNVCAYVYASSGIGETGTDCVYSGHNLIAENGKILTETSVFTEGQAITDIDLGLLASERAKRSSFEDENSGYDYVYFNSPIYFGELTREYSRFPFVPENDEERAEKIENILDIQAASLVRRLTHIRCKKVVIGLSGGLDSTLAILAVCRAYDKLLYPRKDIIAVTMPCFGTTDRTKNNSVLLAECLGVTLKEIDITKSVLQHFEDIGHDKDSLDVTYENAQARERTQVIMDIANQVGGIVIGTGDLSELALGWATYNGDHMSMFGINASIPKTLIRHIVGHVANRGSKELSLVLSDILNTPVSPELIPADGEEIKQKTEDIVGPYELHDFFIYHFVKNGFAPSKIYKIALKTFENIYSGEVIYKWLESFINRFFTQQFKRSCLPDGVKVDEISFSPRTDWKMPSDMNRDIWLEDLKKIKR